MHCHALMCRGCNGDGAPEGITKRYAHQVSGTNDNSATGDAFLVLTRVGIQSKAQPGISLLSP